MEGIPVAAVVGPTASGKTALGVELALRFGGEVISADSMQVYRGMQVGTAKPTDEEMRGVPHHLIDILPPAERFSVARWCGQAAKAIEEVRVRGRLPILVGGTGLYISSLLDGIDFLPEQEDASLRIGLKNRAEQEGIHVLLEELAVFDPKTAAALHPNDVGRIVRAIEFYRSTGVTMTQQRERSNAAPSPYHPAMIGLDFRDRAKLYDRINRRVDVMVEQGLLREAEKMLQTGGETALQAIGYKELTPYFRGECTLDHALLTLKQQTRRYAKRQLTWFRRDTRIHWLFAEDYLQWEDLCAAGAEIVENAWNL